MTFLTSFLSCCTKTTQDIESVQINNANNASNVPNPNSHEALVIAAVRAQFELVARIALENLVGNIVTPKALSNLSDKIIPLIQVGAVTINNLNTTVQAFTHNIVVPEVANTPGVTLEEKVRNLNPSNLTPHLQNSINISTATVPVVNNAPAPSIATLQPTAKG